MQQRDNRMRPQRPAYGRSGASPRHHRVSGNARQKYEAYRARARAAQVAGDVVEAENCDQHAEHYWRVMRAAEAGS
jgi:hypothetical protein